MSFRASLLRRARGACTAALLALIPGAAAAQDIAVAEALFNTGLADMKAGKLESGCKALAESQRIDPRPGTLFTLASCEAQWGHIATAVTRFRDYLATYQALPPDRKAQQGQRPKVAKAEIDKLARDVPQLTLTLPAGAPSGVVVKRDGDVVASAALGVALPADPGDHIVSTETPGGGAWEQKVTLARGEKKTLVLVVRTAPSGGATSGAATGSASGPASGDTTSGPAPGGDTGTSGRRVATYVIGGVGVAGLIAGGVLGGLALDQKGTFDAHCGAAIGLTDETACDRVGLTAVENARTMGIGSTIGIAAGAAAVGVALVLFVTESKPDKAGRRLPLPWITAGRDGAQAGVMGAF